MAENEGFGLGITRRGFMKGAATAAALGMFGTSAWFEQADAAQDSIHEEVRYCWHKTHCQGCCSLACTVRDGRLAAVEPNGTIENKRYKKICLKGIAEIQQVYSSERIQTPLRRVGERGSNQFEPITWDEAFEDIYQNISAIQAKYGKDSVWAHVASECSEMNYLANIFGCIKTTGTDGSDIGYGSGIDPATNFLKSTYAWATNGSRDWKNSEYLLIVGTNYLETSLTLSLPFFEAKETGTEIVTVDPHFSTTARSSSEWVPIEPGTDMAMWLGMVSHVIDNKLYDEDFMRDHTSFPYLVDVQTGELLGEDTGELTKDDKPVIDYKVWDEDSDSVVSCAESANPALDGEFEYQGKTYKTVFTLLRENQRPYTLEWASGKCKIPASKLAEITEKIVAKKTAIAIGHGGNDKIAGCDIAGHALVILVALLGNMGAPGVAFGCYQGGREHDDKCSLGAWPFPEEMAIAKTKLKFFDLPDLGVEESNIHAVFFVGGGLAQGTKNYPVACEWAKTLDYLVVNDIYFSDSTPYADIILPSCSPFESREEVGRLVAKYNGLRLRQKVIEPLFDSRTNYEILNGIAEKFGLLDKMPQSCEELARYELSHSANPDVAKVTVEDLVAHNGFMEILNTDTPKQRTVEEILQTPTGRCEVYYENQISHNQQLPNWDNPLEVYEDNPLREKYPLAFNENTSRYFIHDAFHTATWIWQFSHALVEMNPADMEARGLVNNDHIRAYNDRGEFGCLVRSNNAVRPGVVRAWQAEHSRYMDFGSFADVLNDKTHERGRILRSGPSVLHSDALIQVEKA